MMVECTYCKAETDMDGTEFCDSCWELKTRIERSPAIAKLIMNEVASAPKGNVLNYDEAEQAFKDAETIKRHEAKIDKVMVFFKNCGGSCHGCVAYELCDEVLTW